MVAQRDVLEMLRQAAIRALDESWDIPLPSTLVERAWVGELRTLRASLRGKWGDLGLDVLLRGRPTVHEKGPSDALIFGMSVDAFLIAIGATSAEDVASAAASLLDRSRYRKVDLVGPATHAGIDVVRASHGLLGRFLGEKSFSRIKELTANSEAVEWDIQERAAREMSAPAQPVGSGRSIIDRMPLFHGLRPRRPVAASPEHSSHVGPHVNVALLAATGTPEHLPRVAPGSHIWLVVGVGPHAGEALTAPEFSVSLPTRVRRELVDVVVLPDPRKDVPVKVPPAGQLRVAPDGAFGVTRPAGVGPIGNADSRRLYFALQVPYQAGEWRVLCVLAVRGVVVHVEEVTVVVGDSEAESSARTAFRLVEDLSAPEALAGLDEPTLTLYASGDEGRQRLSLLLPGDDGIEAAQVSLDADRVAELVDVARTALGEVTGAADEHEARGPAVRHAWDGVSFGDASDVAHHLVALARAGRQLRQDVADELDRIPSFAHRLREVMRAPGSVQLAIRHDTKHVVPLQLLYDFPLSATAPLEDLSVCDASQEWLATHVGVMRDADALSDVEEPPCIAGTCPQEGDDTRVCIAGFWGYRHQVSSTPASETPPPSVQAAATQPGTSRPTATATVSAEHQASDLWRAHRRALSRSVHFVPPASDALMEFSAHIEYFLTRIAFDDPDPYLEIGSRLGDDEAALPDREINLDAGPLVVLNTYESPGATPGRILSLVEQFLTRGASGAVSTEAAVSVDLAAKFGEAFIRRYAAGVPLAEAMRRTRIELLALGSPLGLAYVCFGQHNLHLAGPAA